MMTSMYPSSAVALTEILEEVEALAELFYVGILADDLDSDREEYVTSHRSLLRTLNPGIVSVIYYKTGREEMAILQFKTYVKSVNITRMTDEDVTRALMDCAWEHTSKGSSWGYARKEN